VGYGHRPAGLVEAFMWKAETGMVGLGLSEGYYSSCASAISADGSIVVGYMHCEGNQSSGQTQCAMIWDQTHGMRLLSDALVQEYGLDLNGWTLVDAYDISPDGRAIVGLGINPQGGFEAWRVILPEPASLVLLALGGLAVVRRRGMGRNVGGV
jgi:uncharacterized membrane protein